MGGRLAGACKLQKRLARLPAVKVIGKVEKRKKKKRIPLSATPGQQPVSASVMAIAESIADALGLTPGRKSLVMYGAAAGFAAGAAFPASRAR